MTTQLSTTGPTTTRPETIPGYTWRPMRREDIRAVYEMLLAVDQADDRNSAGVLEDAYREFDDPWCNPATDSLLVLAAGGQVAALVRTFVNPQPDNEVHAFLWIEAHPDHRGQGMEEFLLNWAEARGRQRLQTAHATRSVPRDLRIGAQDTQHDRIALIEQHGFQPIRYFYRMRRDLRDPIPTVSLAEGLTLRTFTPELSRALMDAFNESFSDHWSFQPVPPEDWQMFFMRRSTFRPDLTFLAMDGDQIAGHSINYVRPEENAREGINQGWIGQLGVRRPWRKRGIASALICESMRAFKAEGLDYATLGVDTENPTGALRIYERLGFVPVKRFISFGKPAV